MARWYAMGGSPGPEELAGYLDAARRIAAEAARVVRQRSAGRLRHRLKPDGSFLTEVDLEIEDLVRSRLRRLYPHHGVVGEEGGAAAGEGDLVWIVDPVDGTHSLRHRVPLHGTLLALSHGGEPLVGVIALPELRRIYSGARGLGCARDGSPLRLAAVEGREAIAGEIVATGERRQFVHAGRAELFDALMRLHPGVRTYCDCFGHALAIEGAVGAMVDFHLRIWDVAASEVLIREVGGRFVRLGGGADAGGERFDVLFGKPAVVDWIVDGLRAAGVLETEAEGG